MQPLEIDFLAVAAAIVVGAGGAIFVRALAADAKGRARKRTRQILKASRTSSPTGDAID